MSAVAAGASATSYPLVGPESIMSRKSHGKSQATRQQAVLILPLPLSFTFCQFVHPILSNRNFHSFHSILRKPTQGLAIKPFSRTYGGAAVTPKLMKSAALIGTTPSTPGIGLVRDMSLYL